MTTNDEFRNVLIDELWDMNIPSKIQECQQQDYSMFSDEELMVYAMFMRGLYELFSKIGYKEKVDDSQG